MKSPLEISNGRETVKIYRTRARGRLFYQLSFYRAGRRERRTFADKERARREARTILCQLASEMAMAADAVSVTDVESLVAARAALGGLDVPLHLAVEGFAGAVRRLCAESGGGGRMQGMRNAVSAVGARGAGSAGSSGDAGGMRSSGDAASARNPEDVLKLKEPVAALDRAVTFYLKHHPMGAKRLALGELSDAYIESRRRVGVSKAWLGTIQTTVNMLLKKFPRELPELPTGKEVTAWLEESYTSAVTKNTKLRTLKAFAAWSVKEKLAGMDSITPAEFWKVPAKAVEIYTPAELEKILRSISKLAVPFVAIGAFAGLRAAEVLRLDWSEIDLERGHIVVAASKAKTAARRLAPVSENLRAWLSPFVRKEGPVVPVCPTRINKILTGEGLPRKRNALRHSYISYRLAVVHDAPRVALEAGNSPAMIFKHYRELVTEAAAKAWFEIVPGQKANSETIPQVASQVVPKTTPETASPRELQAA